MRKRCMVLDYSLKKGLNSGGTSDEDLEGPYAEEQSPVVKDNA